MNGIPVIITARLVLRPFTMADAAAVQQLAGSAEVAASTQNIPHPYRDGMAEAWIGTHAAEWETRTRVTFAVTTDRDGVIGAITLRVEPGGRDAEMGYWIGMPFWNRGYATEAARAAVEFGFDALGLDRVFATHFTRNPASGRVMAKAGMRHERSFVGHATHTNRDEPFEQYGLMRGDRARAG